MRVVVELDCGIDARQHLESLLAAVGRPLSGTRHRHPFRHGRWLWVHNGLVNDFGRVKRDLTLAVDDSLYPSMEGSTDSELLFYLALTLGLEDDPPGAVGRMVGLVEDLAHVTRAAFRGDGDAILLLGEPSAKTTGLTSP